MSIVLIRALLEQRLAGYDTFPTAWEGVAFTPTEGVAWQRATLLPARPDNPTMGDGHRRELGLFQIDLFFPSGSGTSAAAYRADSLAAHFARGLRMTSGSVQLLVPQSPGLASAKTDSSWIQLSVQVPYSADVFPT